MRRTRNALILLLVSLFVVSTFSFMGCTKHPNAEQLQALEEQKNAALSAENSLEECRREKSRLESQFAQKKQKLAEAKAELEEVKKRLAE